MLILRVKAKRGHLFTREKLLKSIEMLKSMRQSCDQQASEPGTYSKVKERYKEQAEIYTTAIEAMETILYDL